MEIVLARFQFRWEQVRSEIGAESPFFTLRVSLLHSIRPVNQAAFFGSEAWLIPDITKIVQLFNAFVVSRHRGDPRTGHQACPGNREWTYKSVTLEMDKQCSEQTHMGRHQAFIAAHAFDPLAVVSDLIGDVLSH